MLFSSVPVLFIGVLLATFFVQQRFHDLEQSLEKQGEKIATAFSHGIFESLTQRQGHTIPFYDQRILEEDNVRSVAVYDLDGELLTRAGPKMRPLEPGVSLIPPPSTKSALKRVTLSTIRIIHPIYPASSYHPLAAKHGTAGWIEIEVDRSNLLIEEYRSILYAVSALAIAIILNAIIAVRFSSGIGSVVQRLRQALKQIAAGNLQVRLEEDAYGELRDLQVSLNQVGSTLLKGQQDLQQNVHQAEEDLRQTMETIEIQNIELDLARKEALEASRIKSEFLANMSHEIRTPLNGIIGFTNLLLKSPISATQKDYLDTIQKSSKNLLSIINDVLDFSKIEAGMLVLDQAPLNFQEIVEEVLTIHAPLAYEKRLEQVSLFYSDVPTLIIGDSLRLQQILTNLVNNAIKFTEQGEVVVRVMLDHQKDDAVIIKVSVSDTGIGLSKEEQRALFNAFRQADTSTARRFGGTGLGLVISKHLVELMRGQIGLESEPGQGSTFWFTFRADIQNTRDTQEPSPLEQRCNVAIYDHNATVRANLRNALQKRHMNVTEFSDLKGLTALIQNNSSEGPHAMIIGVSPQKPLYSDVANLYRVNQDRLPIAILGNPEDQKVIGELTNRTDIHLINKPICQQKAYQQLLGLLKSSPNPSQKTLAQDNQTSPQGLPGKARVKVIAVDDNDANLKLLQVLLHGLGVEVFACDSGIKALEQMEHQSFDLAILDIRMPVMDGIEVAKRIREMEGEAKRTPIIALTAHAMDNEKQELLKVGMDGYLTKPIDEAQLIQLIERRTGEKVSSGSSQQQSPVDSKTELAVDMDLGLKLANYKQDLAEEMLEMLFNSLNKDKEVIQVLLEDEDFETLQEVVHKLHGATRYTGVPDLQKASNELEECLKLDDQVRVQTCCEQLLIEIDRVLDWCQEHRNMIA